MQVPTECSSCGAMLPYPDAWGRVGCLSCGRQTVIPQAAPPKFAGTRRSWPAPPSPYHRLYGPQPGHEIPQPSVPPPPGAPPGPLPSGWPQDGRRHRWPTWSGPQLDVTPTRRKILLAVLAFFFLPNLLFGCMGATVDLLDGPDAEPSSSLSAASSPIDDDRIEGYWRLEGSRDLTRIVEVDGVYVGTIEVDRIGPCGSADTDGIVVLEFTALGDDRYQMAADEEYVDEGACAAELAVFDDPYRTVSIDGPEMTVDDAAAPFFRRLD